MPQILYGICLCLKSVVYLKFKLTGCHVFFLATLFRFLESTWELLVFSMAPGGPRSPYLNLPAKPQLKSCPLDTIVSSVQWSFQKRTAIVTANQALFLVNYITFWKQRCHRALRLYWGWECNSRWEIFENLSRRKK